MPMLPLFTDAPAGVDHSRTIADLIGVTDSTAFVGAVNYAYILRDSIGVSDTPTQTLVIFLPPAPTAIRQAALIRAYYW